MSLVWAALGLDVHGTPTERCVTAKHAGLKRGEAEDSQLPPHLHLILFPGTLKIFVLCCLRVEKFISWVLVCVLFLERLKQEKVDLSLMPELISVNTSTLIDSPHPHPMMWAAGWGAENTWVTQAPELVHNNTSSPRAGL